MIGWPDPELTDHPYWVPDGLIGEGEYRHSTEVEGITFHWVKDGEHLYAAVAAETAGWVAVGFDPDMQMPGANIIFGHVKDRTASIEDMFGIRPNMPDAHPSDEQQGGTNDVLEYAGREEGGLTVIEFKIPLDSGDRYDKPLSRGASYPIILAMGPGDDFDVYHGGGRTYGEITLD